MENLKTFINTLHKEIEERLSRLGDLSSNRRKYKADIQKLLDAPFSEDYKNECKELLNDEEQLHSKRHDFKDIMITPIHVFSLPRPSIQDHVFTNIENDIRGYLVGESEVHFNRNSLEAEVTGKVPEASLIHVSYSLFRSSYSKSYSEFEK